MKKTVAILSILILSIAFLSARGSSDGIKRKSAGGVTRITAGTSITISPTNGMGNVTINSSASGGGSAASTFTAIMTPGNVDIYLASSPVSSQDTFLLTQDTLTITAVTPFCTFTSTVADVILALVRTTETANTNVVWLTMDASSFTVPVNNKYGTRAAPATISNLFPRETMALWTTMAPSSGTIPANCGLSVNYFKWPRP